MINFVEFQSSKFQSDAHKYRSLQKASKTRFSSAADFPIPSTLRFYQMSSQVLSKANAALNASKSQLKDRIRDFSVPATRTASTPVITTPVQSSSSNKRAWTETVTTRGVGTVAVASTDVGLQKNRYSASSATSSLSGKLYQIIDHLKVDLFKVSIKY